MSVDICYIVSHGFASRMITQTDLLGRLRARGLSVAVIAPDAGDPVLAEYCRLHAIELVEFRPRLGLFSDDHLFKRRYYLEDIRANPALWEKHLAATRFHPARNPFKRLRPHWYYLMHRLIPRFPGIRERFKARERRFLHSPDAERLIATLAPRKLIATYPVTPAEAILLHYGNREPGVETWIHLLSWDNITCKGRFVATADRYIAWGPVMRDELKAHYGVPDERIHACGVPHFDLHADPRVAASRPEVLQALGLDAARPYAVFAMSSPRFAPNEIDLVEWLADRVGEGAFGAMQLLVRPHPQNVVGNMADASWLPRLQALAARPGIGVAFPKLVRSRLRWSMQEVDMLELAAMLSGAAAVLNSGSTVSIDALMHGKPVLITAFDADRRRDYWDSARRLMDYPHLKMLVDLGGVRVTHDYADLERALGEALRNPQHGADRRASALIAECLSDDGRATGRVVDVLSAGQSPVLPDAPTGLSP
jgi:hypothetical protein